MNKSIKEALIRQSIEILKPWLDVSAWEPKVDSQDGITAAITFKNSNGKEIIISSIYFEERTGEMLQWGTNYGYLVL